ncbi:hypothetical protein C7293_23470 [filamentous cyanobacterium CCT1]|nr:hypothetical protein C7293_23470 [filamentous cyanobacterium CCT1]PSN80776.1 hypothetical protein C8B47_04675 [filamentous cyanobacterium CCP4]
MSNQGLFVLLMFILKKEIKMNKDVDKRPKIIFAWGRSHMPRGFFAIMPFQDDHILSNDRTAPIQILKRLPRGFRRGPSKTPFLITV